MNTTATLAHARLLIAHAGTLDAIHHLSLLANSDERRAGALGAIVAKLASCAAVLEEAEREIERTCAG